MFGPSDVIKSHGRKCREKVGVFEKPFSYGGYVVQIVQCFLFVFFFFFLQNNQEIVFYASKSPPR